MSALACLLQDHDSEADCHAQLYELALTVAQMLDNSNVKDVLAGLADGYGNPEFARLLGCAADVLDS